MRILAVLALAALPVLGGVRGDEVMYLSGTIREMPERTEGHIFMPSNMVMQFLSAKGEIRIPVTKVTSAVYLEKRVSGSPAPSKKVKLPLLPGIPAPKAFRDGKQRTLTLTFLDAQGAEQKVVLLVAKKMASPLIHVIETHGGKQVDLDPSGDYDVDE